MRCEGCCFWDHGCTVLTGKVSGDNCKFFKTTFQFYEDQLEADRILASKGLERYTSEDNIIRTRPRKEEDW